MKNEIQELCDIYGISGREADVAAVIVKKIRKYCECKIDNLGNVIVFKQGKKRPKHRVMLAAHMDEVGFLVSGILESGELKLAAVGGIDPNVLAGQSLVICTGRGELPGVIGTIPIHLQSEAERYQPLSLDSLTLDIGCHCREESEKFVKLGDMVCFARNFEMFGSGLIKSKAQDDRIGCAILIRLIQLFDEYDFYATFCTMEEIGSQGASVAAFSINPEIGIVVECTTAADISSVKDEKKVCRLNAGPVISFMDKGTIYDPKLVELAFEVSRRGNIKTQVKEGVYGGNDSRVIQTSGAGVKSLAISLPTRYLHSPASVSSLFDVDETISLLSSVLREVAVGGDSFG